MERKRGGEREKERERTKREPSNPDERDVQRQKRERRREREREEGAASCAGIFREYSMHCHSGLPLVHPLDDSKPAPVTQGEGSCTCRANGSLAELRAYTRCRVFDSELTNDTTPSKNFSSCVSSISLVYRHESFPNPKSIHPPFIFQQRGAEASLFLH